ncbi:MAG: IPTL-CTERM sorting domain-containing protein [Burkholderiales bacterium]
MLKQVIFSALRACSRGFFRRLLPALALAPALAFAQSADIVINHADSPDPAPAGGIVSYAVRVDNNGPNNAVNVRIADTLPPGSTFISATPTAGSCAAPASGVVSCTLGNIPFTQPVTTSQTVTVRVRLPVAGVYTNTVTATSDTADPNPGNNTNSAESTTAVSASDMRVVATAAATVTAGQVYNHTVTASNLGPNAVPSTGTVTVSFIPPSGGSINSIPSGTGWTCTPSVGYPRSSSAVPIDCTRAGPLAVGALAPVLTVPAVANIAGSVSAAFAVSSSMPDGDASNNTATVGVTSGPGSDVQITMTASATTVVAGTNVTYTLTPRHNGGQAPGSTGSGLITVVDTLGAGLSFVSVSGSGWSGGNSGQTVTCTRPGPYTGGNFTNMPTIAVVATASAAGTLSNSVTISIPETDPTPANNTASVNVTSTNSADLRMNKSASLSPVVANQAFTYSLSVSNLGPLATGAAQVITVNDTIPAGVTMTGTLTATGWTCSPNSGFPIAGPVPFSCTRTGSVAVNGTTPPIVIPVTIPVASGGAINNTACTSLSGAGPVDSASSNDCASAAVTATTQQADLVVDSKTAAPAAVNAGDDLTYVISVRNAGPNPATNATVTDTLASLISTGGFRSAVPSQGSCSPSGVSNGTSITLNCDLGTLNSGATATVTVVVRPLVTVTAIRTNTATINSPDVGDPNRSNNNRSVTSQVTALVDLLATKSATPSPVMAGTPLTYVATVRNNGPSTAATVTVVDTLPSNAAFVSLDAVSGTGTCPTPPAVGQIGGTLNCSWASILTGVQQTVTYRVRPLTVAAGGNVSNSVAVATATQDLNTSNNSASTATPVTAPQLDVLVNKADSVDPVTLGQTTEYTILINNAGPSAATNARLTDIFPAPGSSATAAFSYEGSLSADAGGTCVEPPIGTTAGTLSCSFPTLASGQTATVRYRMTARTLTTVGALTGTTFNEAFVVVDEAETTLANNRVVHDTTARRFIENADLGISKTTAATTASPGGTIDYVLTATNFGPAVSTGAQVIDVLPAGVSLVSAPGCTSSGGTVACAVGSLGVGASKAFNLRLRLDPVYNGAKPLVNNATIDAPGDPVAGNNSSPASTPVVGPNLETADIAIAKTTTASLVAPGGTLDYALTVTNLGPDVSNGASVRDELPPGVSFVSAPGCTHAFSTVTCTIGALGVNSSRVFNLRVVLDPIYNGAKPLINMATVDAPGDPATSNNSSTASTPVIGANLETADISIGKTTTASTVAPGGTIDYLLTVRNLGPDVSNGATVEDTLPVGVSFVSAPGCTEAAGVVSCAVGNLALNGAKTFDLRLKLDPIYNGTKPLVNTASVDALGDPIIGNNSSSASTPVVGPNLENAYISITKTTSATTVAPGGTIDYVLTVTNLGPDVSNGATAKDTLPAGVAFVSAPGCTEAAGVVSCAVGNLPLNGTRTFDLRLELDPIYNGAKPLVNTATVDAPGDQAIGNNSSSASTPVVGPNLENANLSISKTTTATSTAPGGTIDYALTVTNLGPDASNGATVRDTLPTGVSFVSAPGCTEAAGVVSCGVGNLPLNGTRSFNLRLKLDPIYAGAKPLVNTATVDAPGDPIVGNNSSSASTPVVGPNLENADIGITKTTAATTVAPGGTIDYVLTVTNLGPDVSNGATVKDTLPVGVSFVSAPGCSEAAGVVSCAVGNQALNGTKMFNLQLKLDPIYNGAKPLVNSATVEAPGDPSTSNNGGSATTPVVGPNLFNADLALAKTTTATIVAPGGTITYALTVTNGGPDASDGATVIDPLPAGTSFVSGADCGVPIGTTIRCAVGPLANGANKAFNIVLKLDNIYAGANPLVNNATVDAPGDPNTGNNGGSTSTPVAGPNLLNADLALVKATAATTVAPGGTIDYTIAVSNNGPDASDGATVSDPLPAGTTFVSGAGCSNASGTLSCAVGPLANGANRVFDIRLKLDNVYAGANPLVNAATVNAPGDPVTGNYGGSASTSVAGPNLFNADLSLSLTTTATTTAPGGTIPYVLTVANNGPEASDGATSSFTLPAGTSLVSGAGCTAVGTSVSCAVGPLVNGANKVFDVQIKLDNNYGGANPLVLAATVAAPGDPVLPNNGAQVSTPVAGPNLFNADLALTITTTATTAAPGGTIPYVLTVTNNGPEASDGATLSFTLPAGTSFVSGAGCTAVGTSVSCSVGPLANGTARAFNVQLKVDNNHAASTPVVVAATVTAPGDPMLANNSASVSTQVQAGRPAGIPTLSEWGLILLAGMVVFGVALTRRRRGRSEASVGVEPTSK